MVIPVNEEQCQIFSLSSNSVLLEPMKQNCVWFGENQKMMGKNECQGKLVETILGEGGKKICTAVDIIFVYLFYYLRATPSCALPFTVRYFVFSSI